VLVHHSQRAARSFVRGLEIRLNTIQIVTHVGQQESNIKLYITIREVYKQYGTNSLCLRSRNVDCKRQHSGSGTLHCGILCVSGKLRRPWTCDLAHYFCHLFQVWSVFAGGFLFLFFKFPLLCQGLVP
jgi:hypothetical protein